MEKLYTLLNTKADKISSLSQEAAEAHLYAICLVSQGKTRDRTCSDIEQVEFESLCDLAFEWFCQKFDVPYFGAYYGE